MIPEVETCLPIFGHQRRLSALSVSSMLRFQWRPPGSCHSNL